MDGGAFPMSGKRLDDGDSGCAFILDGGASCGATLRAGSSYCAHHHALCHLRGGGAGERRRLGEAEALAAAVGGRRGRRTRVPPDPFLRRLENVARGFLRPTCSRIVQGEDR
jgi:hypothetical protein